MGCGIGWGGVGCGIGVGHTDKSSEATQKKGSIIHLDRVFGRV